MIWKKQLTSYLHWFLYTVLIGFGGFYAAWQLAGRHLSVAAVAIACGVLVVSGLLVLLAAKVIARLLPDAIDRVPGLITEALFIVAALAVGVVLRVENLSLAGDASVYFDAAKILEGQTIPQLVHGAEGLYLWLLHGAFFLFGNVLRAGVWLQLLLQVAAFFLFYRVVRRFAGPAAGVVAFCVGMGLPCFVREAVTLGPATLYFLLLSAGIYLVALMLGKENCHPVLAVLTGVVSGVLLYLDINGILLIFFALGIFFLDREAADRFVSRTGMVILFFFLGLLLALAACFGVDALLSGAGFFRIIGAWWKLFGPGSTVTYELAEYGKPSWTDWAVLSGLGCFGIFSFWCSRSEDRNVIWTLVVLAALVLEITGMSAASVQSFSFAALFLTVCAGIGMTNAFCHGEQAVSKVSEPKVESDGDWEEYEEATVSLADFAGGVTMSKKDKKMQKKQKRQVEKAQRAAAKPKKEKPEKEKPEKPAKKDKAQKEKKAAQADEAGLEEYYEEPIQIESLKKMLSSDAPEAGRSAKSSKKSSEKKAGKKAEKAALKEAAESAKKEASGESESGEDASASGSAVEYIENPLPVPKKHEAKVMDYPASDKKSTGGSDGYDIAVSDDDDYDY